MKSIAIFGIVALLGAGAVYYLGSSEEQSDQPQTVQQGSSKSTGALVAGAMQASTPVEKPDKELPRKQRLYFPDGSYLPALNGATRPRN